MRQLEEMEEGMRLEVLKKGGNETATAKKPKKQALQVEPINLKLIKEDRDKLCLQIYAYLVVSALPFRSQWVGYLTSRIAHNGRMGGIHGSPPSRREANHPGKATSCPPEANVRVYQTVAAAA